MEKKIISLNIKLIIPENRYDVFEVSLKQAKHRFYQLLGTTFGHKLDKSPISNAYLLRFEFDDCRIDKDRQIYRDTPIPGQMNESTLSGKRHTRPPAFRIIDIQDISDIMTEITDSFDTKVSFSNEYRMCQGTDHVRRQTPVGAIKYLIAVTDEKEEQFDKYLSQAKTRLKEILNVDFIAEADKWMYGQIEYNYALNLTFYNVRFKDIEVTQFIKVDDPGMSR